MMLAGVVLAVLGAFATGHWLGYHLGIRETEQRWSDAVGRADEHRKYQATGISHE
jgi:hypothetical protein